MPSTPFKAANMMQELCLRNDVVLPASSDQSCVGLSEVHADLRVFVIRHATSSGTMFSDVQESMAQLLEAYEHLSIAFTEDESELETADRVQ